MAIPTLTGTFWFDDDMTVAVSDHDDMAVLFLGDYLTIHPDDGAPIPVGPERRKADLIVLRDLARRMLVACETALADDRAKTNAVDREPTTSGHPVNCNCGECLFRRASPATDDVDTVSLGSPDYQPRPGEDGSGNTPNVPEICGVRWATHRSVDCHLGEGHEGLHQSGSTNQADTVAW